MDVEFIDERKKTIYPVLTENEAKKQHLGLDFFSILQPVMPCSCCSRLLPYRAKSFYILLIYFVPYYGQVSGLSLVTYLIV